MPKVWNLRDPALPTNAVRVDRTTKWGNPYVMGGSSMDTTGKLIRSMNRTQVLVRYRQYLEAAPQLRAAAVAELRGKDLACWCAPLPCHADVLLEVANAPGPV